MGCSNERTVEGNKTINSGYPVCRLTIPLQTQVTAIASLNNERLVLGSKNEISIFEGENKKSETYSKVFALKCKIIAYSVNNIYQQKIENVS